MAALIPAALTYLTYQYVAKPAAKQVGLFGNQQQQALPGPPTVDEAARNTEMLDRVRRRKGVLANIFGGSNPDAASPAVGTKTLLGS